MSKFRSYRHALTGKVGEFSEAVAKLFPHLEPVDVAPEPSTEVPAPEASPEVGAPASDPVVPPTDGPFVFKRNREVAD